MAKQELCLRGEYQLLNISKLFKSHRYFLSRNIVLRKTDAGTGIRSGGRFSDGNAEGGVKRILSSKPGVVVEAEIDEDDGILRLGVAFEAEKNDLLWFCFSCTDECYCLDYTNCGKKEITYGGKKYTVSCGQSESIGYKLKRLLAEAVPKLRLRNGKLRFNRKSEF
ncbi:MAG: hypothetical protein LBK61_04935 [Spirochaetaceae bacterium]|jgi:hypothetical protein|nr:hypothetical protein [Spirochaetaceae bacterium]